MGDPTIRTEDEYIFADAFIGCYTARLMKHEDLVRLCNCADLSAARTLLANGTYQKLTRSNIFGNAIRFMGYNILQLLVVQ